MFLKWFNCCF